MSCFAWEPGVAWVQRQAVRQALAEPWRARGWLRRARRAAWLPAVKVSVGGHRLRDESVDREVGTPVRFDRGGRSQISYDIGLSWDLPRLIFNPDTLRVVREAERLCELRDQVNAQVIRLYFARRRLQLAALLRPRASPATVARRQLRIAELTALLDAMTGGAYQRELARRARLWRAARGGGRPPGRTRRAHATEGHCPR